jgi:hypothetical protein
MRFAISLCLPMAALMCGGCASIKSTQLFRSFSGKYSGHCVPCSSKGVPCKLKIETGMRVRIHETYFIDTKTGQTVTGQEPILEVATEPVFSDQLFLVHLPRPLAGTLDLWARGMGYQFKDGYLTSIGAAVDDTTLQDLTSVLGPNNLGGLLSRTDATTQVDTRVLEPNTRTGAIKEFSYANPEWHQEMNAWIQQFQPGCTQCGPGGLIESPLEHVPAMSTAPSNPL